MKKLLLIITIIVTLTLTLVGCSSTPVAGRAWADHEVLTYEVVKDGDVIGTMTTTVEVLTGDQTLTIGSDTTTKYNLGLGSDGKRLTQIVTIDGKTAMTSQTLVKNWTTVAGYKMVDYNGVNYSVSTTYADSYVEYTKKTGSAEPITGSINVGSSGYIDNEFIYTYVRAYSELDSSMSKSVTSIDYENMQATSLSISASSENVEKYTFEGKARACSQMVLQHSDSPIGRAITVRYLLSTEYTKKATTNSRFDTYRVPAEIIENNITYRLTKVEVLG